MELYKETIRNRIEKQRVCSLYIPLFFVIKKSYCSLIISREVFLVSEGHRKPETYRANLYD